MQFEVSPHGHFKTVTARCALLSGFPAARADSEVTWTTEVPGSSHISGPVLRLRARWGVWLKSVDARQWRPRRLACLQRGPAAGPAAALWMKRPTTTNTRSRH